MKDTDLFLVNRGRADNQVSASDLKNSSVQDTDLFLVNRGGVDYKVTAADLKDYFAPAPPAPPKPWESKDSWTHITTEVGESWHSVTGRDHEGVYRIDGTLIADAAESTDLTSEPEFLITGNSSNVYAYGCPCKVEHLSNLGTRTDISYMFTGLEELVSFEPGPDWDTTNVTNMANLFSNVAAFTADVSSWNTSNVTNMYGAFFRDRWGSTEWLVTGVSSWDTTKVTDTSYMLYGHEFNEDISSWDVSNVTSMISMFQSNKVFDQDISSWDVGNVTRMDSMFNEANSFNQNIGGWNVANVTKMNYMFYSWGNDNTFNQDLSKWCVSNIGSKPSSFDDGSGFEGETALQPKWGTCP